MRAPSIGIVTCEAARPHDPDLAPLADACRELLATGRVDVVDWDDAAIDWSRFTDVIIRSTWDYAGRHADFLAWLDFVEPLSTVHNPAPIVRWNTDKRYLRELHEHGVAITPTTFVPPGERPPPVDGVHVVKPSVGAGSTGARRCRGDEVADHVALLHGEGHVALVQPYLDRVDEFGETALCFVPEADGRGLELSHAFGKDAILRSTEIETVGDFVARETISPRTPTPDELALARTALSAVPGGPDQLTIARVDVVPGADGPVIMELELIEPSLYFHTSPGSAERCARRLLGRIRARDSRRRATDEDRPLA